MADPITIALLVGGTVLKAAGERNAGIAAQQQNNAQAALQESIAASESKQLKQKAGQERAIAQRKAIEARRESTLAQSKAVAIVAGSGGSSFDPTVVDLIGDLEQEGDFNFLSALYQGDTVGQDLEHDAELRTISAKASGDLLRTAGKNERTAGNNKAFATVVGGAGNISSKYG